MAGTVIKPSSPVCADNPYEQKLFSMFCGHDKDQLGWLSVDALQQLCATLELKEHGAKLIAALTERCRKGGEKTAAVRVTFKAFKEELLHVLGTEVCEGPAMMEESVVVKSQQEPLAQEQNDNRGTLFDVDSVPGDGGNLCAFGGGAGGDGVALMIANGDDGDVGDTRKKKEEEEEKKNEVDTFGETQPSIKPTGSAVSSHRSRMSKSMSPTREVAPKLVMGSKKYGRRSRPQFTASEKSDVSSGDEDDKQQPLIVAGGGGGENESNSENEEEDQIEGQGTNKVHRSASQVDVKRRRQPKVTSTKLKRCASLPARRNMAREFVRIRGSSPSNKKPLNAQLDSSVESLGNLDVENLAQNLYEIWIRLCSELHANSNELLGTVELEQVFGRAGISMRVAEPLSEEIFEKLNLDPEESTINFQQFIGLIQTEDNVMYFANNCTTTTTTNRIKTTLENESEEKRAEQDDLEKDASGYSTATSQMTDYQIVPSELIVDMWETAGIQNAMQLLKYDLGFDAEQINIQQLSQAIDEELAGLRNDCPQDERISVRLMRAALVLNKAELNGLQVALKHLGEENQKLHASNRESNDRVALMAQEVDERHATIEKATQMEIRSLELKHSENVRELSKQLEQDREHWSAVNVALEARIKNLESEEQKLRSEYVLLEERNAVLEAEQVQHQKQLSELLETNFRLNTDICELEEQQNSAEFNRTDRANEEIMELMEKITRLQVENTDLRDRNDELCAELDGMVGELNMLKGRKQQRIITGNNNNNSLEMNEESEGEQGLSVVNSGVLASPNGSASSGQATKRRGDSPSKSKIAEESPRLGKLRKRSGTGEDDGELIVGDDRVVPLNAELETETMNKEESMLISDLKARVEELEKLLKDMGGSPTKKEVGEGEKKEQENAEDKCLNCQDMESTLDLMRKEFDNLEDYWQGKLNEERLLFEEEQRVNDEKFNDLLQKMMEYEEQFASTMKKEHDEDDDGRLSTIPERDLLEQQYLDIEEELNGLKRILREKNEEIKILRSDGGKMKTNVQQLPSIIAAADPFNISIDQTSPPESPASSPINYLWSQSTIQAPARDYQNPNWQKRNEQQQQPQQTPTLGLLSIGKELDMQPDVEEALIRVSPIQKPKPGSLIAKENNATLENCDKVSVASSNDRHSTATYNVTKPQDKEELPVNESPVKDVIDAVDAEELNQQQIMLRQLQEDCKELVHRRDALIHELQQLNDMRPTMEKNFARTIHPSLTSRIQQLEQRNRQLQALLKQQQLYSETIMHQTWQQQRVEIADLRNRLESQGMTVAEQVQRLAKADILVKELFVENSHLRANIQRLEQQTMRSNYMFQQHPGAPPGMNGVPSFP